MNNTKKRFIAGLLSIALVGFSFSSGCKPKSGGGDDDMMLFGLLLLMSQKKVYKSCFLDDSTAFAWDMCLDYDSAVTQDEMKDDCVDATAFGAVYYASLKTSSCTSSNRIGSCSFTSGWVTVLPYISILRFYPNWTNTNANIACGSIGGGSYTPG